jgi:hypothetical protein
MILLIFVICATAAGYSVYGAGNKDEVAVGAGARSDPACA